MRHLDLALLQTFVAIADNGSFTLAAKQVHRTQSAVSLQMQRLEAAAGAPLFRKNGRQMETTDAGDLLLNHARTLLALNDETLQALRGIAIEGTVRLGAPTDIAEDYLPEILKAFTAAHETLLRGCFKCDARNCRCRSRIGPDEIQSPAAMRRPSARVFVEFSDPGAARTASQRMRTAGLQLWQVHRSGSRSEHPAAADA